ncbi:MAG: hypothetical protein M1445_11590 [Bacteroidetes bacterium]|nr:hypothetical protein [Bacteroidota bacterium]
MSFDINGVLADMASAMKGAVGDNWEKVKPTADLFLQRKKERLELLAELRITGELSPEKFESRLQDEKLVAEAELNAVSVISKATAQRAANAAMEVVGKAVATAIATAL